MLDFSAQIESAVTSYVDRWLAQHPYLAWSVAHPLWSVVLLLLAMLAISVVVKAIWRGCEHLVLLVLKTPLKLLQPLGGHAWRSIARSFGQNNHNTPLAAKTTANPTERVEQIVDRLQTLAQEQELLLLELAKSLGSIPSPPQRSAKSESKYVKR